MGMHSFCSGPQIPRGRHERCTRRDASAGYMCRCYMTCLIVPHGGRCRTVQNSLPSHVKLTAWANRAYLSYRKAMHELRASQHKVKEWFSQSLSASVSS